MSIYGKTGLALIAAGLGGSALLYVFSPADMRLEIVLRMGMTLMMGVIAILVLVVRRFPMSAPPAARHVSAEGRRALIVEARNMLRDPEEQQLIDKLADAHNALEGAWNRQDKVTFGPLLVERDLALQALLFYFKRAGVIDHVELNRSKRIPPPVPRAVDEIPWDGLA